MLKTIAQDRTAETNTDIEFGVADTQTNDGIDTSKMTYLQGKMVDRLRDAGGIMTAADLENDSDKRTLKALRNKEIVTKTGWGDTARFKLANMDVEDDDDTSDVVMTTEEFRELLTEFFGKGAQTKFATLIGVNKFTVAKWANGVLAVPQYVAVLMRSFEHMKEVEAPMPRFIPV